MIRNDLKLSVSIMRKFNNIFKDKEKTKILNEALYFANIYTTVTIEKHIEYVINKYIKVKIHKRTFCDINRDVVEYKKFLMEEYRKLR